MRSFIAFLLIGLCPVRATQAQEHDVVVDAVAALQRGDLATAESALRSELEKHPNNEAALEVFGVVLDQEKKYQAADGVYRRALPLAPRSVALLNNYGNHLLAMSRMSEAREIYLRVLALDPRQANAALQLAHIALQRKAPAEALKYLEALPPDTVAHDPQLNLAMGIALAGARKYDRAEQFLSRAVDARPDDFEALYDLGLAASHAGHNERARTVLEKALLLQPENVDAMYDLAAVDAQLNQKEAALALLARAARIAPQRADILSLLAHTSADLGYFGDAAKAWTEYLRREPGDEAAARERAFAQRAIGDDVQRAMADLRSYAERHPADAVGHYELAMAQSPTDRETAKKELDRALALKPDFTAARMARGLLSYRQGKTEAALADFALAAKQQPSDPAILDRLGQAYMTLGRTSEALPVLRKAAEFAPRDSTILFHYARALSSAGQKPEASAVFARCRELGPGRTALPHPAGLIDFLSLSPEEQRARYRAGVEHTVQRDPANVEAQVRYMELLLEDSKTGEAAAVSRTILSLNPSAALAEETARALIAAGQYDAAKAFLESYASENSSGELQLDQAIADAHAVNSQAGLDEMNHIPEAHRDGDYYLALAAMLQAAGRSADSTAALQQALTMHSTRADLYREAASEFINHHSQQQARQVLAAGTRALPEDAGLSMMKDALEAPSR